MHYSIMSNDEQSLRNKRLAAPLLSLRQIARGLGIPPSTVTYYKDRFSSVLPKAVGTGRNRRYPQEALEVFGEIRELFACNWPAAQIEAHLAGVVETPSQNGDDSASRPRTDEAETSRTDGTGPSAAPPGALEKRDEVVERVMEAFDAFRATAAKKEDVEALKQELAAARQARERLERELATREAVYLARIEELAAQGRRLEERLNRGLEEAFGRKEHEDEKDSGPPGELLDLPLVILNEQGEYLGVSGGSKPFSLGNFLTVMEKGGKRHKIQAMNWSQCGKIWRLAIKSSDAASKKTHEHVLETESLVTPLGNRVMRLSSLHIDGQATPNHLLLLLFRNIRDGFAA